MSSPCARRRPVCRARLVLMRPGPAGPEVLLTHHRHPDRSFWCFPGGGVEPGESLAEAALREAEEEIGLRVALRGICFLQDRLDVDALDVFFLAEPGPGSARLGHDPERAGEAAVLSALRWFPVGELGGVPVLPADLAAALASGRLRAWGLLPPPSGETGA